MAAIHQCRQTLLAGGRKEASLDPAVTVDRFNAVRNQVRRHVERSGRGNDLGAGSEEWRAILGIGARLPACAGVRGTDLRFLLLYARPVRQSVAALAHRALPRWLS